MRACFSFVAYDGQQYYQKTLPSLVTVSVVNISPQMNCLSGGWPSQISIQHNHWDINRYGIVQSSKQKVQENYSQNDNISQFFVVKYEGFIHDIQTSRLVCTVSLYIVSY